MLDLLALDIYRIFNFGVNESVVNSLALAEFLHQGEKREREREMHCLTISLFNTYRQQTHR